MAIGGEQRTPEAVLDHPKTRRMRDLTRPVDVLLIAARPLVADDSDAHYAAAQLVATLTATVTSRYPSDCDACEGSIRIGQECTTNPIARDHAIV